MIDGVRPRRRAMVVCAGERNHWMEVLTVGRADRPTDCPPPNRSVLCEAPVLCGSERRTKSTPQSIAILYGKTPAQPWEEILRNLAGKM